MGRSVLDALGEEVTGIVSPVSLCMGLTVLLVRVLNPTGQSDSSTVAIAQAYYHEKEGDSAGTRLGGSLINALIFVAIVAVMTFVLVLLFKYGYTKIIWAYMAFSGFSIFFVLAGVIALQLIAVLRIPIDIFSFVFYLYNFAVVGVTSVFLWPAPLAARQGYLVAVGVITAYVFTFIPEWTTWAVLLAMAAYDLCAVLTPGGPLKMLVEMAQEREEPIPALVYEARPTGRNPRRRPAPAGQEVLVADVTQPSAAVTTAAPSAGPVAENVEYGSSNDSSAPDSEQQQRLGLLAARGTGSLEDEGEPGTPDPGPHSNTRGGVSTERTALLGSSEAAEQGRSLPGRLGRQLASGGDHEGGSPTSSLGVEQVADLSLATSRLQFTGRAEQGEAAARQRGSDVSSEDGAYGLPDAIKLGLGDFIFYSVLVGRAAMYDMLTAFAAYLAIVAGLGITLLLLALHQHALPALPISITLGVVFYFAARAVLEPFVLPLSVNLIYF